MFYIEVTLYWVLFLSEVCTIFKWLPYWSDSRVASKYLTLESFEDVLNQLLDLLDTMLGWLPLFWNDSTDYYQQNAKQYDVVSSYSFWPYASISTWTFHVQAFYILAVLNMQAFICWWITVMRHDLVPLNLLVRMFFPQDRRSVLSCVICIYVYAKYICICEILTWVFALTLDSSLGLWADIQSAGKWVPQTPHFESWSQQRKTIWHLSIRNHFPVGEPQGKNSKYVCP